MDIVLGDLLELAPVGVWRREEVGRRIPMRRVSHCSLRRMGSIESHMMAGEDRRVGVGVSLKSPVVGEWRLQGALSREIYADDQGL